MENYFAGLSNNELIVRAKDITDPNRATQINEETYRVLTHELIQRFELLDVSKDENE